MTRFRLGFNSCAARCFRQRQLHGLLQRGVCINLRRRNFFPLLAQSGHRAAHAIGENRRRQLVCQFVDRRDLQDFFDGGQLAKRKIL
jgi:hypothetical protein